MSTEDFMMLIGILGEKIQKRICQQLKHLPLNPRQILNCTEMFLGWQSLKIVIKMNFMQISGCNSNQKEMKKWGGRSRTINDF